MARFCSSINLENFGIRTDNCRSSKRKKCGSSKKEQLQEFEKGIIAGAQKLAIAE